ncbi:MAG: ABC transporter permease, partial [Burkholderiales bacterium]
MPPSGSATAGTGLTASRPFLPVDSNRLLGMLLVVVIGMMTLVPVVYIVAQSFNLASPGGGYRFGTLAWEEMFSSPKTLSSMGYSFLLAIRIPMGLCIALAIAWLLVRVRIPFHGFIEYALWFAFFLPLLPMTMGWILLLDADYGLVNLAFKKMPFVENSPFSIYSVPGIIWVHLTLSTVPIMVILLAPALRQLDGTLEEAADMCGAGLLATLRRITIPLIGPAILTAFVAGFIRSLEVFEIEQLLGTPANIFVYATRVYDLITWDPPKYPQAMALSALFLVLLLGMALLYQYWLRRLAGRATITGKGARLPPRRHGKWAYLGSAVILLYVAISIVLPLVVLVLGSFNRLFGFFFTASPWTLDHWRAVLSNPGVARAPRH